MKPVKQAALCVLFSLLSICAHADALDDFVTEQMARKQIPGASVAVVRVGKPIKSKGYGKASLELPAPVTAETVFEIGSITKQFTATLVMMLMEEGRVGLDDKLMKYFTNA